jgi:ABC-type glycerol-3-phosphate transport system substrate-binding protein
LSDIRLLPDERILCTEFAFSLSALKFSIKLTILTKTALSDLPERIVLTLATTHLDQQLETAVVEFNRRNLKYFIEVTDYSQFGTDADWRAGHTRLTTEIISGKVPDIIDVGGLPVRQYINKGLLEDLYEFIDSDPEFDRSHFIESALRAAEANGSLYYTFPEFAIHTIVGNPSVLGFETGWNINEFIAVIEANPDATIPLGSIEGGDISAFVSTLVFNNLSEYIDWLTGTANFDRGDFAKLLEFAKTLDSRSAFVDSSLNDADIILSGEQIMEIIYSFSRISEYQVFKALFGNDLVFKGYPVESRHGNIMNIWSSSLAISTTCKDKEGAWEFVRTFLTEEWQMENIFYFGDFPVNKAVFDARIAEAMSPAHEINASWKGYTINVEPITQEEADQIIALVDSMSTSRDWDWDLWVIIREGIDDFVSGKNSAEDTARIIQSRASIYMAEQN